MDIVKACQIVRDEVFQRLVCHDYECGQSGDNDDTLEALRTLLLYAGESTSEYEANLRRTLSKKANRSLR